MEPAILGYAICGAAGALGSMVALGGSARVRELKKKPKLSCGEARERTGPARVVARIESKSPLRSPVSERPCVYYTLGILRTRVISFGAGNGGATRRPERVCEEASWAEDLVLADDSGKINLKPGDAQVELWKRRFTQRSTLDRASELVNRYGLPEGHYTWKESLIHPGTTIEVSGTLVRDGGLVWLDGEHGVIYGEGKSGLRTERAGIWLGWLIAAGAAAMAVMIYSGLFS